MSTTPVPPAEHSYRCTLGAIVALGLALRIAGAQGGLWLDEAWSAVQAHEVGTPAGVFLGINHDNNHHLNSLWLQAVGLAAPSWLMRLPSIVAGTLAIPLAAAIARPRGTGGALTTALLFAMSPMLVTMGSEARGYAAMVLALLGAILCVDRALAGDAAYRRPTTLALCFALGALAQLTMVFGALALCGWVFINEARERGVRQGVRRTVALFLGPMIALIAVLALVFGAAWASPTGFRFGSYQPFALMPFLRAIVELTGYTMGWPVLTLALPAAALVLLIAAPRLGASRPIFYALAIFAFPAGLALLHAGNTGHARYYLLTTVALLLMLGEIVGGALNRGGWWRWGGLAALAVFGVGAMGQDLHLAANRRGDPSRAIAAMAGRAPDGASVLLDRETGRAILRVAAAQPHYRLTIVSAACPPAPFAFVDRFSGEALPRAFVRCGRRYSPVASARARGLSGSHWTLYARAH